MKPVRKMNMLIPVLMLLFNPSFSQVKDSSKANVDIKSLSTVLSALDNNPALLSFDDKINSTKAYAKAARSIEAPKVSAGLWMYPYTTPPRNGMGEESADQGALMFGVEQMIMNPARRKAEQKYMEGMASVDQSMKSFDKQNMVEEAKKMYFEWIILKKKLKVLKESEELINVMIRSGEIGYTYNQNELSRIYKAKSELYNIQNMIIMTQSEISQMNVALNTMMNIDKSTIFDVDTNYVIQNYETIAIDTAAVINNRSDIKGINETLKTFELRRKFELSKRNPDFGIQYAHMNNFGDMMPNQFNLMGMLTIPIAPWSAKEYKANLEGIKLESRSLNYRKQAILNEVAGNLGKLKYEISNKKRQMDMYEKNLIPALQKNFSTSLIAFEHMKEDMFMTIDAWMALKMAKIEYLDIIGSLLKLQAAYERQIETQ